MPFTPPTQPALPTQIGPYRILSLLGEGGMGAVYEAMHESIERRVALKVLLPEYARKREAVTRFFNEARAVNRIEHSSIVQVSDFGQAEDGSAYLVMEFLRGESLTQRLDRLHDANQRLPLGNVLNIAAQIADALTAAHEKGIIHRDLKPGNVMLVRDSAVPGGERVKILDFGIAKLTQDNAKARSTATDMVMGTPQYMSPEQCRGAGGVDEKTDVYALGVMLYEMFAGRTPFIGEGSGDFIGQHMFKEPLPLLELAPKTPGDVAGLIHRLLIKDKAARPAMRDVGLELSRLLNKLSGANIVQPADLPTVPLSIAKRPGSGAPSTLGRSLGQTLPWLQRPMRMGLMFAVLGLCVVTLLGLVARALLRRPPVTVAAQPMPIAPPSPPALPAPAEAPPKLAPPAAAAPEPPAAIIPLAAAPHPAPPLVKPPVARPYATKSPETRPGSALPLNANRPPQGTARVLPKANPVTPTAPRPPVAPPAKRPVRYED